jgi:DNA-binding transcriptional MerR regulator
MADQKTYRAKEVCEMFDISKVTLFRWEKEGKIAPVKRDWRGWRIYTESNITDIRHLIQGQQKLF